MDNYGCILESLKIGDPQIFLNDEKIDIVSWWVDPLLEKQFRIWEPGGEFFIEKDLLNIPNQYIKQENIFSEVKKSDMYLSTFRDLN